MSAQGKSSRRGVLGFGLSAALVVAAGAFWLGPPPKPADPPAPPGASAPALAAAATSGEAARPAAPALAGGVSADWWSRASALLAAREYEATSTALGLQAPNRAQGLRTYFREDGIEIVPRTENPASWSWTWRTTGWGREGSYAEVAPAEPTPDAVRVEYRRPSLTEWYQNGPDGVEQGFTVIDRPGGAGPLCIAGAIGGSLSADRIESNGPVDFLTGDGLRALRYDGLQVTDARGRELPSSLDLADGSITIRIDDSGATYPVTVDPILTTPDWTEEPDHASARFGQIVSTAGDVNGDGFSDLLVSGPGYDVGLSNSGRVFVYHGSAAGLPATPDWWKSGDQMNSFFGQKAGTAGDVNGDGYDDVIISSQNYSHGESFEGRAWIFYGSAAGLAATAAWDVEGNQVNAQCGFSVGCAGDVNGDGYADVFVGAEGYSHGQADEGVVWVFHGAAGGIDETADWTGEANDANGGFGSSASGGGDVNGDGYDDLVVGAPGYENPSGKHGRAFIYYGSAGGLGNTPWTCEPSTTYEMYAAAVAGVGDVNGDGYADVAIGAPDYSGDLALEGKVYLHFGSSTGPPAPATWSVEGNQNNSSFGLAVATAGDVNGDGFADFLVGAEEYDADVLNEGKAYLYLGRAPHPLTVPSWTVEGDQAEALYGSSVATAGDVDGDGLSEIVVGAPDYDNGQIDEGRAYVYAGAVDPPPESPSLTIDSDQAGGRGGACFATAGDVNADGFSDVLIGAPYYDNGQADEGVVFLFLGGPQGMGSSASWYAESNQISAHLGECVASAGDVNGDGLADILAGAPEYDRGQSNEGAAFVWQSVIGGGPSGHPTNASWIGESDQADAGYGYSVAPLGDVNGDGFGDIIVGAYGYDDGQTDEGAAFAYHGSAAGLSPTRDWYRDADLAGARFGFSVSSAGDFNGDGYSDAIVGAYGYDHPSDQEGLAFVYQGGADGLTNGAPYWYAQGDQEFAWLGACVACAGDINGDGYSDIIIGVPQHSAWATNGGRVLVWYGGATAPPSGTPFNADWTGVRARENARFGWCVGSAGDVNGDGYSDILIGTPFPAGVSDAWGFACIWYGSPSGVVGGAAVWTREGTTDYAGFGDWVASVGDVNGDGFGDVMIGAQYWSDPETDEGCVFLHYGNGHGGLSRAPMQWQNDYDNPIAPLGWSEEETRFALRGIARTAAGRGTVRLVWEVKEALDPFDGTGTGSGSWWDTGTPVSPGGSRVTIFRHLSGFDPGKYYHWRMRFEAKNPYFPRTRWLYLAGNAPGEADLRMDGANSGLPPVEVAAAVGRLECAPNPFADRTQIRYALAAAGPVRLTVHDVQGRRVTTLVEEPAHPAGAYVVVWDGRTASGGRVPAGVYFCRLEVAGWTRAEKVLVAR